jgi:hypothetical protein
MSTLQDMQKRLHQEMGEGGDLPWPDEWIKNKKEPVHLLNIALAAEDYITKHEDCYCEISSPCNPCINRKKALTRAVIEMENTKW